MNPHFEQGPRIEPTKTSEPVSEKIETPPFEAPPVDEKAREAVLNQLNEKAAQSQSAETKATTPETNKKGGSGSGLRRAGAGSGFFGGAMLFGATAGNATMSASVVEAAATGHAASGGILMGIGKFFGVAEFTVGFFHIVGWVTDQIKKAVGVGGGGGGGAKSPPKAAH